MSINALSVANAILDEADTQGICVSPMQLQKLIYFAHGWHLELTRGTPLVSNNFKAWKFGPVMPRIYHEFKKYGANAIDGRALNPVSQEPWSASFTPQQISLFQEIIKIYGKLSGPQMSHLTHKENTPWSQTWNDGVGSENDIPNQLIAREFKKIRDEQIAKT